MSDDATRSGASETVSLATIAREWTKLGCIGFGGPPTHIVLLRRLCVEEHQWLDHEEFEDAIATTNLLPGPASTQLVIYCAWKLRGARGAVVGGLGFICPGLFLIIGLSVVFLAKHPPIALLGAAAGAGATAPAVALSASRSLVPSSWARMGNASARRFRRLLYASVGAVAAVAFGEYLVIALLACGASEVFIRRQGRAASGH